jgi:4-hydroxybenzoate polyprenyltransferase
MEDMDGDARYGRHTMPVAWGIQASRVFALTWLMTLMAAVTGIQFYILQYRWWGIVIFSFLLVILPIIRIVKKLFQANDPKAYHRISSLIKIVMMMGILSMVFLKFYTSWIG